MASHKELLVDWNCLDNDCNNWTLQDLQLAAELGRTLLERNEELETELKEQQVVIDDQGQEIEFLTKQVNSMKEESASRSKFYEQLETSICELERTNSQIGRKHEVDKKRIQSLCENLEYLERKCEELNVTLQSLRSEQGKKPNSGNGANKVNRSSYFSFGSDSSEEEMSSGFGLTVGASSYRKKSHSLQDLRDYTPSPDEFDSGNSNSPDLKSSETEFIDSLETRIEELQSLRKKETDKVRQLETQIKLLIQENANLQQQIVQISSEKDEEISELRRHLKDSSNYNSQLNASFSAPLTSTRRNSDSNSMHPDRTENYLNADFASLPFTSSSIGLGSSISSSINRFAPPVCKRCSAEINVLNLVNSIEHDSCYEWEFGSPEDDNMEFSSLEHELARATGTTPYHHKDNRFINASINNNNNNNINNNNQNFLLSPIRRSSIGSSSSSVPPSPKKLARSKKLKEFLRTNPSQIDIEEMDYENSEIFDIFFGHDDKDETGEDVLTEHSPSKVRFSQDVLDRGCGSSSTDEENDRSSRTDEDPCLIKDRKPEFAKNKLGKPKSKKLKGSSSSSSAEGESKSNGCVKSKCETPTNSEQSGPSKLVVKNLQGNSSRFLQLPTRIPSDDEADISSRSSSEEGDSVSHQFETKCQDNQIEDNLDDMNASSKTSTLQPYKKRESSSSGYDSEYSSTSTCKPNNNTNRDARSSSSECSTSDSEVCSGTLSTSASTVSILGEYSAAIDKPNSRALITLQSPAAAQWTSPMIPEYRQILQSLFSMFNNSKRKYPIPMYPFIQEARRQSSGLIYITTARK